MWARAEFLVLATKQEGGRKGGSLKGCRQEEEEKERMRSKGRNEEKHEEKKRKERVSRGRNEK